MTVNALGERVYAGSGGDHTHIHTHTSPHTDSHTRSNNTTAAEKRAAVNQPFTEYKLYTSDELLNSIKCILQECTADVRLSRCAECGGGAAI